MILRQTGDSSGPLGRDGAPVNRSDNKAKPRASRPSPQKASKRTAASTGKSRKKRTPQATKRKSAAALRVPPLPKRPFAKSLGEELADLVGALNDLPPDFAQNHDHYIHGAPKKA